MILVSTGTNGKPFDRLLSAVGRLEVDEELVVQHGPSNLRAIGATCLASAGFNEFSELVREARVVITHGGVGSVLVALANGKRPLVVPRLARYGEAVDDHQLDFARRLDAAGLVTVVSDPDALGQILSTSTGGHDPDQQHAGLSPLRPEGLATELGQYLNAVVKRGDAPGSRPLVKRGWMGPKQTASLNVLHRAGHPMSIAVVVLTYNRVHLLRQCVENVLLRTSSSTQEIVIWNNGSTDGTREYLDTISDPRIRVVNHPKNVGLNAYALAFRSTTSEFLVEVDDDMIDAPVHWDAELLEAFQRLPTVGYLAASLRDHEHDVNANIMYRTNAHLYSSIELEGVKLKIGPVGGGCTMTSRELHDRVGGFRQYKRQIFWQEDGTYIRDIQRLGYRAAYLEGLEVLHAGGPYFSETAPAKKAYWEKYRARQARKNVVKRLLLRVPFIASLNARHGWFVPPVAS